MSEVGTVLGLKVVSDLYNCNCLISKDTRCIFKSKMAAIGHITKQVLPIAQKTFCQSDITKQVLPIAQKTFCQRNYYDTCFLGNLRSLNAFLALFQLYGYV